MLVSPTAGSAFLAAAIELAQQKVASDEIAKQQTIELTHELSEVVLEVLLKRRIIHWGAGCIALAKILEGYLTTVIILNQRDKETLEEELKRTLEKKNGEP